jgi:hypothetical protein
MKFTVRFQAPTISVSAWEKRLDTVLSKQIEQAAKVWLNATVLLAIPVWSGASRATFLKLAREVSFPLTITGIKSSATGFIQAGKAGPRLGFQQSRGEVSKGATKGVYTFTYGTTLFHLVFNEFQDANANPQAGRLFARLHEPGPYNFQEIGKDAFEDYAKDAVELPSPWRKSILKIKRIRAG